ncbi:DUF3231 family protein [Dehalobacter restrictus]|jgi:hypothetical protein|uniref:DUF3231 family protein n=1 Tax=Dehalobacter restrictus (strain DSM 9455 / PER-K23) TaxID=871738 RepID=A0ABM5P900_DEHRP|nr:DUF3231 family protein [Dehalobacter restrictus]AHF11185.1 hypothetical protein DEHRE_00220 [Dehalobacter restrictus DSM 9455]
MVLAFAKEEKMNEISVGGVYSLWNILTYNYGIMVKLEIYQNYAHDIDLKFKLQDILDDLKDRNNKIEKIMNKYNVKSPDYPPKDVHEVINSQVVTDQQIGKFLLLIAQERLEIKVRAVRNASVSDDVRSLFMRFVEEEIYNLDSILNYLKLKKWVHQPPMYPNVPEGSKEDCYLWDHLVYRYLNMEQIKFFSRLVHDGDFGLLLNKRYEMSEQQAKQLEDEMNTLGLPIPKRPPKSLGLVDNTEFIDDYFIFNQLLYGMTAATINHAQAVKCSIDDRLRKLFGGYLWSEMEAINAMIKYGGLKGWLITSPLYRMNHPC